MKSIITLLAASLLLVFTLAACGGGDTQTGANDQNNSGVAGGTNEDVNGGSQINPNGSQGVTGSGQNGTNGVQNNGTGNKAGGSSNGNDGSLANDAKDALDGVGDALTDGGNAVRQSFQGRSFDQMVRNARVHDKDGDLKDNENSAAPGSTF